MTTAYICQGVRTPIGRYAGALAVIRTDDLAANPLKALRALQDADVILHDRLVPAAVLDYARRDAERICVGKAAGGLGTTLWPGSTGCTPDATTFSSYQ